MSTRATISLSYNHLLSIAAGLGTNRDSPTLSASAGWANGTGAGQVNVGWHDKRTLTKGASEDLDLSGVLTVAWATIVSFDAVKALIVQNTDADEILTIGPTGSNDWSTFIAGDTIIRPGGSLLVMCGDADTEGYAVTAGTGDQLRVTAGGSAPGTVIYKIALVGIDT